LENLGAKVSINRAWETIRENIKIPAEESLCYYELKKHKTWCDERCSKLLDQRSQDKLQWLQYPSDINGDNLNIWDMKPTGTSGEKEGISERQN
jgi:hypothetical protein